MGNQLAPAAAKQGGSLETGELQNVVVKETLGGGRFLKSLLCLHDNGGLVVVKAFYKRKDATSLASHKQQLQAIRDVLLGLQFPHVWPMQTWWETPNAACMMRQHFFANLYDRLSTRPFLTAVEKRWITFQLLHGLSQAHAHGVCHGDIKCENVMVTSWNWLLIVDFASYKPTYLPADNPADFSYYFDTGSRRRCYLAPERFFEGSAAAINTIAPLQPDMDVFSLGCVIAELWLDGRAFFDLSRLLAYRRGEYDPTAALAGVEADIAELVMHMIQRSPGERWNVDHYLTSWPRQLFPPHFSEVLHPFFNSLLDLDPDARLAAVATHYEQLAAAITADSSGRSTATVPDPQVIVAAASPASGFDVSLQDTQLQPASAAPTAVGAPAAAGGEGAGGSKLLAEVDSLLCDVTGVQRRLAGAAGGGGGAAAAEDDGICIDELSQPTSSLSVGGVWPGAEELLSGGAQADVAAAAGELIITEEWYEHQVRDASNQWVPASQAATCPHCTASDSGSSPACRADVVLPVDGAWQWAGDWQLQVLQQAGGTDTEGWQYTPPGPQRDAGDWSASAGDQPLCRRRRWTRQRRRLGQQTSTVRVAADRQQSNQQQIASSPGGAAAGHDQGMVLLAVLICTLLRGSRLQESKRAAIMLLFRCGLLCDDDVRLQTIVPYLLTQLSDPSAGVRTLALRCVVQLMASLSRLPPADAKVYHDYLLPSLSLLPNDPEEAVRVAYALAVAHLAAAAHEHLLGMQFALTAPGSVSVTQQKRPSAAAAEGSGQPAEQGNGTHGTAAEVASTLSSTQSQQQQQQQQLGSDDGSSSPAAARQAPATQQQQQQPIVRYDAEMAAVRGAVEKVVLDLVTGTRSSADIKRGLLSHAHQLGLFFGRRDINDLLLPLLITCLNAGEWQLRGSFFGAIAAVGPHTGRDSLDVFLLPCLEQALVDTETAVVCDAVRCLAAVCGHLRKRSLLAAAGKVAPLLRHPSAAVRHSAVAFIAAAARALPPADVYTQLSVMVSGFLQQQPLMLTDEAHLAACLHPSDEQQQQQAGAAQVRASLSSSRLQQQSGQAVSSPDQHPGAGAPAADGGLGSLLTQPGLAAVRPSSSSSSSKALISRTGMRLLSRTRSTQDSLVDAGGQLNLEGSDLVLQPSAPVYCLDIDPAVFSNRGGSAADAGTIGTPASSSAVGVGAAAASAGAHRSRWGYRLEGFAAAQDHGTRRTIRQAATCRAQNAAVGPGLAVQPGAASFGAAPTPGAGSAASSAVTATAATAPGNFWPGTSAELYSRCSNTSSSSGGLLTGLSPGLGVGPGGWLVGPIVFSSGAGLRPRPKSSHTAAVESISKKQAILQERYDMLCEALAKDPTGLEASDRQQLDRLAATLHRLSLPPGNDVRCPAALLTYKMAAVTSRAGPGAAAGATGDNSAPAVYDAVSAAISTGIGQHLPGPGLEGVSGAGGPSWRPRGVLASHLQEHRAAVNCLATSANGAILLSGSDDETVKVWDIRRLERDVTFASRLTYAGQSGRITGLCPVLDGSSVASGSSSGSLHVWRVEYSSKPGGWAPDKYRGITAVRQLSPGEGSVLQVVPWGGHPALLLYTSQRGGVHCCDLRCAADVWHVPAAPSLGLPQHLVPDPSGQHWLAQGTSRGWVCLWDVRFLLCVNSWQHPQRCGIDAMSLAVAAPPRLGLQQGSLPHPGVPLLYMSAGMQEVGLWDVLDGRCHQVLRVLNRQESQLATSEPPAALQPPLPSAAGPGASTSTRTNWTAAASSTRFEHQLSQGSTAPAAAALMGGLTSGPPPSGSSDPAVLPGGDVDVNQLASELSAHLAMDQVNCPQARLGGVTALLPLPGGALLAGGADRCVRYWDGSWPERSYIVTGPVWPDDTGIMDPQTNKLQVPGHVYRYSKRMLSSVPVLEERCMGDVTRQVTPDSSPDLGSKLRMHDLVHADCITQLLAVEGASKLLVSASRDGCIKVWK